MSTNGVLKESCLVDKCCGIGRHNIEHNHRTALVPPPHDLWRYANNLVNHGRGLARRACSNCTHASMNRQTEEHMRRVHGHGGPNNTLRPLLPSCIGPHDCHSAFSGTSVVRAPFRTLDAHCGKAWPATDGARIWTPCRAAMGFQATPQSCHTPLEAPRPGRGSLQEVEMKK
jgi:hypothetical protein